MGLLGGAGSASKRLYRDAMMISAEPYFVFNRSLTVV